MTSYEIVPNLATQIVIDTLENGQFVSPENRLFVERMFKLFCQEVNWGWVEEWRQNRGI